MTETTQVERVARAMCNQYLKRLFDNETNRDAVVEYEWHDWEGEATAAIKAMSDAEPVAWKCQERTMGAWHTRYVDERPTGERYRNIVPLYAHPPAAEPIVAACEDIATAIRQMKGSTNV